MKKWRAGGVLGHAKSLGVYWSFTGIARRDHVARAGVDLLFIFIISFKGIYWVI